jgi:hypothetical protein
VKQTVYAKSFLPVISLKSMRKLYERSDMHDINTLFNVYKHTSPVNNLTEKKMDFGCFEKSSSFSHTILCLYSIEDWFFDKLFCRHEATETVKNLACRASGISGI